MKINCHPERVCGVAMITADRCLPCDDYLSGSRNVFGDVLFFFVFLIFLDQWIFLGVLSCQKINGLVQRTMTRVETVCFLGKKMLRASCEFPLKQPSFMMIDVSVLKIWFGSLGLGVRMLTSHSMDPWQVWGLSKVQGDCGGLEGKDEGPGKVSDCM